MELLTRKFTIKEYHDMGKANVFHPEERLELIKGEIIKMSPIGLKHAKTVNILSNLLTYKLYQKAIISVQNSIRLKDNSEPQPDIVLVKFREDFYANKPIEAEDVYLLIEVSDSTLKYDREIKIPLYAENNINEVWLVNINNNTLEIYRQSDNKSYQNRQKLSSKQTISPLDFPELIINLANILD